MAEYIERDALKERFELRRRWLELDVHDEYSRGLFHGCETDMELVSEISTADVAPVVHGRWEDIGSDWFDLWRCSACGTEWSFPYDPTSDDTRVNYCPDCGARMDGEG